MATYNLRDVRIYLQTIYRENQSVRLPLCSPRLFLSGLVIGVELRGPHSARVVLGSGEHARGCEEGGEHLVRVPGQRAGRVNLGPHARRAVLTRSQKQPTARAKACLT